jgi:heme exporter protein A
LTIIAGLRKPSTGAIYLSDPDEDNHAPVMGSERREFLEYLPAEGNGFFPSLAAEENLSFWRQVRQGHLGESHAAKEAWFRDIDQALSTWGLKASLPHLRLNVGKFSTGMRRRLAMARLQLSPAAIWLLDEPLYGLDRKGIELFAQLLETHRSAGGLTLLVTHDLAPLRLEHALQLELQRGGGAP